MAGLWGKHDNSSVKVTINDILGMNDKLIPKF